MAKCISIVCQAKFQAQHREKRRIGSKKKALDPEVYLRDSPRSLVPRHAASLGMEENDLSADITLLKF